VWRVVGDFLVSVMVFGREWKNLDDIPTCPGTFAAWRALVDVGG
jgi:hypothetical protein